MFSVRVAKSEATRMETKTLDDTTGLLDAYLECLARFPK
jgi:hypothetical protein